MAGSSRGGRSLLRVGAGIACGLLTLASACGLSDPPTALKPGASVTSPVGAPESAVPRDLQIPLGDDDFETISLVDGFLPVGLAAAHGSIWAPSHQLTELARIDPSTNRVVQTVDIGQRSCGVPLAAFGDVWALPCGDSRSIIVVEARTGRVRGRVENAVDAEAAAGSVWCPTVGGTTLQRIDPKTFKVGHRVKVDSDNVAFDGRFVWSFPKQEDLILNDRVAKVDPSTDKVVARYRLPLMDSPSMTYGFGALWFKTADTATLYRFDVSTGRTHDINLDEWEPLTAFHDQPPAIGAGSVWIRVADGIVIRIDPTTNRVIGRYMADPLGGGGYLLVAFGSLWVANYDTASIWREQVRPHE